MPNPSLKRHSDTVAWMGMPKRQTRFSAARFTAPRNANAKPYPACCVITAHVRLPFGLQVRLLLQPPVLWIQVLQELEVSVHVKPMTEPISTSCGLPCLRLCLMPQIPAEALQKMIK